MNADLTFNALDVETANPDRASICQIGVVQVQGGIIRDQWSTLINPREWFDPWNVEIHGIDEDAVKDSPTFPEISDALASRLDGSVVVSHTSFDRVALERATTKHGVNPLRVTWLDSAIIVRRAWPDRYGRRGYGLRNVANDLGISFQHHDALEDARAAAEIVVRACADTGAEIAFWLDEVTRRRRVRGDKPKRVGKDGGALNGETIVFTGALSVSRREVADLAAAAGSNVASGVSGKTTILVVGLQDMTRLNGYKKSSKQRKAEDLIVNGADIQIISESDFFELVAAEKP